MEEIFDPTRKCEVQYRVISNTDNITTVKSFILMTECKNDSDIISSANCDGCGKKHYRCKEHADLCKHWSSTIYNVSSPEEKWIYDVQTLERKTCCNKPCIWKSKSCNKRCAHCGKMCSNGINNRPVSCESCGMRYCGIPNCRKDIVNINLKLLNRTVNICTFCINTHCFHTEQTINSLQIAKTNHCKGISIGTSKISCKVLENEKICGNTICIPILKNQKDITQLYCHHHSTRCNLCNTIFSQQYIRKTHLDFNICMYCDDILVETWRILNSIWGGKVVGTKYLNSIIVRKVIMNLFSPKTREQNEFYDKHMGKILNSSFFKKYQPLRLRLTTENFNS
jgi:hypothetical protein